MFVVSLLSTLVPGDGMAPRTGSVSRTCDAYTQPGLVQHNPYPVWKPYDPLCEAPALLPNLLATLPSAATGSGARLRKTLVTAAERTELSRTLQNRTVLLVGDAVDRTLLMQLCQLFGREVTGVDQAHPWGESLRRVPASHMPSGSAHTNPSDVLLADYCYEPVYDTLFTSFYHYGADTDDRWQRQASYFPPGRFEHRMSDLLRPYLDALVSGARPAGVNLPPPRARKPDLAVFSSSFWDLALWAQEDAKSSVSIETDLSSERVAWWRSRMEDMIDALREQLGVGSRIAWRSAHVPAESSPGSVEAFIQTMHRQSPQPVPANKGNPIFSVRRVSQLNAARRSMVPLTGHDSVRGLLSRDMWSSGKQPALADVPFGEVTLGQSMRQMDPLNPGVDPSAYLFWSMVLARLRELA